MNLNRERMVRFAPVAVLTARVWVVTSFLIFNSSNASASDLEDLARDGYAVVEETRVFGEFEGCDFYKRIPLMNGHTFVCSAYSYSYSYMPEVLILQHVDSGVI